MKNIETSGYCGHAVLLDGSSHCEVRDSYIHNSADQTVDDADPDNHADAYGIEIYGSVESSYNLVENNVLDWFRHALILQWSCNNNVYAYNFAWTNWSREYSVTTDFELHHTPYSPINMAHSIAYTLIEGNSLEQPGSQNASHRNNTWFRNRVVNSGINMNTNNFALGNELTTKKNPDATTSGSWANYIFGIKGTSVAHGNYITDPPTGPGLFWDDSIVDHDIPDSFYLDAKPDWFGDLTWPPFGGDLMPVNTNRSPAEVRFWNMQFPEEAPSGLVASISGSDVALSWSSNSTNRVDFIVCRSSDNVDFDRIAVASGTTYTDTVTDDGQYYYYVRAMNYLGGVNGDEAGGESDPSNVLCVAVRGSASTNNAPVFSELAQQVTNVNTELSFTVTATDIDGDSLIYSSVSLPDGAVFTAGTATFTWTPDYDQSGNYNAEFSVSDGQLSDNLTVSIAVGLGGDAEDNTGSEGNSSNTSSLSDSGGSGCFISTAINGNK